MNWKLILLALMLCFASEAKSHEYYFAFAEMEYRQQEQKLELTLILSSHDLEPIWMNENIIDKGFRSIQNNAASQHENLQRMQQALLSEFIVRNSDKEVKFTLQGFELTENGLIQFYLSAEKVELAAEFEVQFSTLMKQFPKQQNKITYINNKEKRTAVFLLNQQKQTLTR